VLGNLHHLGLVLEKSYSSVVLIYYEYVTNSMNDKSQ